MSRIRIAITSSDLNSTEPVDTQITSVATIDGNDTVTLASNPQYPISIFPHSAEQLGLASGMAVRLEPLTAPDHAFILSTLGADDLIDAAIESHTPSKPSRGSSPEFGFRATNQLD